MIKSNVGTPIQAFPLETTTESFSGGVTGYIINEPLILHMNADGNITLRYNTAASTPGTLAVSAVAGSDWAIAGDFDSVDVDASCLISKG